MRIYHSKRTGIIGKFGVRYDEKNINQKYLPSFALIDAYQNLCNVTNVLLCIFSEKVDSWLLKNALIAPHTSTRNSDGLENINMNGKQATKPHPDDDCDSSVDTGNYIREQKTRKISFQNQNRSKIKNHALENGNYPIHQMSDDEGSLKLGKSKNLVNNNQEIKQEVQGDLIKISGGNRRRRNMHVVFKYRNGDKKKKSH